MALGTPARPLAMSFKMVSMIMPLLAMTRKADDDGGEGEVLKAGHELLGDALLAEAGDDARDDAHGQEDGGELVHVPTLAHQAPDDEGDAAYEDCQHGFLLTGEGGLLIHGLDVLAQDLILMVGEGLLGVLADAGGIEHHEGNGEAHDDHEHDGSQPQLRVAGDP